MCWQWLDVHQVCRCGCFLQPQSCLEALHYVRNIGYMEMAVNAKLPLPCVTLISILLTQSETLNLLKLLFEPPKVAD